MAWPRLSLMTLRARVPAPPPPPLLLARGLGKKKVQKRSKVKPCVKYVNYNHLMPTRYQLPAEIDTMAFVSDQRMDCVDGRTEAER